MSLRGARRALVGTLAVIGVPVLGAGLAGCGSTPAGETIPGKTLTIYSSLPMTGGSRQASEAVLAGARMALGDAGGRVGRYQVRLHALDDSTPERGEWDPGQTTINARLAAADPTTVAYVGELNSGASAVSIPLINRAGIVQVSPGSTAVGLTSSGPGSAPGEPQKYYPSGIRTFARVVPSDAVQAAVQVRLQQHAGCRLTYVLDDSEVDGEDAADSFSVAAQNAGLRLAAVNEFPSGALDYSPQAAAAAASGADCVMVSALPGADAVLLTEQVAAASPHAKLFGTAGVAESTFVDPRLGGLPQRLDHRLQITSPALGPSAYPPEGERFLIRYTRLYGSPPPEAIFGYDTMSLLLASIGRASHGGTRPVRRSRVLSAVFATRNRQSVLGAYSLQSWGDTTLRRYGVFRVTRGRLAFAGAVQG